MNVETQILSKVIAMCSVSQWCLTLCKPVDCSLPGYFVHGIFQARNWKRLPFPPLRDLPDLGIEHMLPEYCIRRWILYY